MTLHEKKGHYSSPSVLAFVPEVKMGLVSSWSRLRDIIEVVRVLSLSISWHASL